jgi:hypothetical protein
VSQRTVVAIWDSDKSDGIAAENNAIAWNSGRPPGVYLHGRYAAKWLAERIWWDEERFEEISVSVRFDDGSVEEWDIEADLDVSFACAGPRVIRAADDKPVTP